MRRYYPTNARCPCTTHCDARRQAPLRARAVRDDRRSLRFHHRRCCRTGRIGAGSGGSSRWRRRGRRSRALDLATGTGDIAFALRGARRARRRPRRHAADDRAGARKAKARRRRRVAAFLVGDMLALPFPAASFDLVTTGYGLRNVPDLAARDRRDRTACSSRAARRCRSISTGRRIAIVRAVYLAYLTVVGGALGWILHRDPDTYRYIPASIRNVPGRRGGRAADARRAGSPQRATTTRCSAG